MVALSIQIEVGDGTTSSVVLAGALLEKAEDLISIHVHPTVIIDGYGAASDHAPKLLQDIPVKVDLNDKQLLMNIAKTSMYSKLVSEDSPILAQIPIAKPIVSVIFQNIMTKEQVIDLANKVAKNVIREIAQFMKGNLTLELFLSWLMTRMEHSSEVNYTVENNRSPQIRIVFKHDLGEDWSIYHKIILEHIFYEILCIRTVWIEVSSTTFLLCFK